MNTERGIIIGPQVEIDIATNLIHLISTEPNPQLLRHAVLYWDKIDFPQNNLLYINSPDIDFLEQEGIAQQTDIRINQSGNFATLYVQAQFEAFELLNQKDPDKWAIGQYAKNLIALPSVNLEKRHLVEMEINNILPVPPDDIPLADLLELKQKRKDEFALLRISIDELFDNALKWESLPHGKNMAIINLEKVITDIRKFVDTSWLNRGASLKLEFNLPTLIEGFLTGQKLGESIGIPGLEYVGSLLGIVRFEKKLGISAFPENTKNFAALYYIEKEFPGTIK